MKNYLLLSIAIFCLACQSKPVFDNVKEYKIHLLQAENGYIKSKEAGGVKVSLLYMPANYLIGLDKNYKTEDTTINAYEHTYTFLLSFTPNQKIKNGSIMTLNVTDYEGYKERVYDMNFEFKSKIFVKTKTGNIYPVLADMENTYGLTQERKIHLVFPKNEIVKEEEIDIIFDDDVFDTGRHHFVYTKKKLEEVPELKN